jgi:hypothetical protein
MFDRRQSEGFFFHKNRFSPIFFENHVKICFFVSKQLNLTEKTLITKKKKKKWDKSTQYRSTANGERTYDWPVGMYDHCTDQEAFVLRLAARKERRQRVNHPNQNQYAYKLARTTKLRLFRKKAGQLDENASIEIERHRSIQDSRKFYKRLNDVRRPFEPQMAMCRVKNGDLLTNKNQVLARRKEHFEEHLNKAPNRSNQHDQ